MIPREIIEWFEWRSLPWWRRAWRTVTLRSPWREPRGHIGRHIAGGES